MLTGTRSTPQVGLPCSPPTTTPRPTPQDSTHRVGTLRGDRPRPPSAVKQVRGGRVHALPWCSQPDTDGDSPGPPPRGPTGAESLVSWQILREDRTLWSRTPFQNHRVDHLLISIRVFHSFHTVLLILNLNTGFVLKETVLFLKYLVIDV